MKSQDATDGSDASTAISPLIPFDFGGYDSRFLGIDVKVNSADPRLVWGLLFANCSLTAATSFNFDLINSEKDWFSFLSAITLHTHESQHLVDYLYSPWGGEILRCRMRLSTILTNQTGMLVQYGRLSDDRRIRHIPAPYARWCQMPPAERIRRLSSWNSERRHRNLPDINIEAETFAREGTSRSVKENFFDFMVPGPLHHTCIFAYDRLEYLNSTSKVAMDKRKTKFFSASAIFEASAVLAQLQMIAGTIGDERCWGYLKMLLTSPHSNYNIALIMIYHAVYDRFNAVFSIEFATAVIAWSLLGDIRAGAFESQSPTRRFLFLLRTGLKQLSAHHVGEHLNVAVLFAIWDRAFGDVAWSDALERNIANFRKVMDGINKMRVAAICRINADSGLDLTSDPDDSEFAVRELAHAKTWSSTISHLAETLTRRILTDPNIIARQNELQTSADDCGETPTLVTLGRNLLNADISEKILQSGAIIVSRDVKSGEKGHLIRQFIPRPRQGFCIDPFVAVSRRIAFFRGDLLYSENLWKTMDQDWQKKYIVYLREKCRVDLIYL
jgi:hypothetical protein